MDSACTVHLTDDVSVLKNFKSFPPKTLDLGGRSTTAITGVGDVEIISSIHGKNVQVRISGVNLVPGLGYQLLSVSTIAKRGVRTIFDKEGATLHSANDDRILLKGSLKNGLYRLDAATSRSEPEDSSIALLSNSLSLWHERLCHVNSEGIKQMVNKGVVTGIKLSSSSLPSSCQGCILGKSHRNPIPKASAVGIG